MKYKLVLLLIFCCSSFSCKSYIGKELSYEDNGGLGFQMEFINDSVLKVRSRGESDTNSEATFRYQFLKKEILEKIRDNQPAVNFKTTKLYGQYYQNIAIELMKGENQYFNKLDTLIFVKMRIDNRMTKRIYFDGGNQFIEI